MLQKELLRNVIDELHQLANSGSIIARMPDGSLSFSVDVRTVLKLLSKGSTNDKVIRKLIIDACQNAENVARGSTIILLKTLSVIKDLQDDRDQAHAQKTLSGLLNAIQKSSVACTKSTLDACINNVIPNASNLISSALDLAGSECKIFVEPSTNGALFIERVDGNTFVCNPDPFFLKSGKWTAQSTKIMIVDGVIENVSEIDGLLENCNRLKQALVIFARGFNNDVLTTLRTNFARRTLNVLPVVVAFDIETANVLVDIAVTLGTDVVSSLKGELITAVKFEDLKLAKNVNCTGKNVTIVPDVPGNVSAHLEQLIKKRQKETLSGLTKIIDARIRSLSSSSVVIKLPDDGPAGSKLINDIDAGLILTKNTLRYGVISPEFIDDACYSDIISSIIDGPWPLLPVASGIKHAIDVFQMLATAEHIITVY